VGCCRLLWLWVRGVIASNGVSSILIIGADECSLVSSGINRNLMSVWTFYHSEANAVALGTDSTGNYLATVAGNSQIGVSGSGSETAAVSSVN